MTLSLLSRHAAVTIADLQDRLDAGGFTFCPITQRLYEIGDTDAYVIAVPGSEIEIGPGESFRAVIESITRENVVGFATGALVIGGWRSPERGYPIVELAEIHYITRAAAIQLGADQLQHSIFDLLTGEEIIVDLPARL